MSIASMFYDATNRVLHSFPTRRSSDLLGADTAPSGQRAQYLGIWRLFSDTGGAAGPLVVAAGPALGSLAAGIVTMGALSGAVVAALLRWVPRWSVHANATTRRRARAEDG